MVTVKIFGGLGNQLFQYAFGRYLAEKLGTSVQYDAQTEIVAKNFTSRKLTVSEFFPIQLADKATVDAHKKFNGGVLWRIERKLVQKFSFLNSSYIVQDDPHSFIEKLSDKTYYEGYWQNHKYTDAVRKHILEHVKLSSESLDSKKEIIEIIKNCNAVGIHIRRGDYLNIPVNAKLYHACDMDYYYGAINIIESKYRDVKYFIFTQDADWAKENFKGEKFHFVEGNSPVEDVLIMSFCKHNIIANSTFSWWSAWLNQNPDKMVIAPKKWYKSELNNSTKDLIPNSWIRL